MRFSKTCQEIAFLLHFLRSSAPVLRIIFAREKTFSPVGAPRLSLLPHSPRRTQVPLKSLLHRVSLTPDPLRTHGRPSGQECRLRLKRPAPNASRRCPLFKSSTAFRALAPAASFRGSLCFDS